MSMILAPPSHRRSCLTCATAKRRCDLRLPQCSRCLSRATHCSYANEPLSSPSKPHVGGTSPLRVIPGDGRKTPLDLPSDGLLSDIDFASILMPNVVDQWSSSTTSGLPTPMKPPAAQISGAHNGDSMAYLVTNVKTYPAMFVFQGMTPFIHSRLYHGGLSKMMQDAFAICAVYLTLTETNRLAVFHIMEAKVAELIHESNEASWSTTENLTGVQALILVHIIQLFDGDIRQRALAEQNEAVLVRWTDQLHIRTKDELISSTSPVWPSWIFAESLRRTILMSHILRGLYSCIKLGFCNNVASMAPLLFTAQAPQWDSPVRNKAQLVEQFSSPPVVSYHDFVLLSDKRRPVPAEAFERLLLFACKGEECTDILEPEILSQEVYR